MITDDDATATPEGVVDPPAKRPRGPKSPKRVNGLTTLRVRSRLYLNVQQFSTALGLHPSTVYRWEVQAAAAHVRPQPAAIIAKLHDLDDDALKALGVAVRAAIDAGQAMRATQLLLNAAA